MPRSYSRPLDGGLASVNPSVMTAKIKRIYEPPDRSDGFRVLVDRLWPRGISKQKASLDLWAKDVAPSPALRTWFDHKPERFSEFTRRYRRELAGNSAWNELRSDLKRRRVTLLYGAKDPAVNHATVLMALLNRKPSTPKSAATK
jgi:uncharacterized protein YeaO (DUF488 family)